MDRPDYPTKIGSMRHGQAHTLLGEVANLLRRLLSAGESGSIDLSHFPLADDDFDLLEEVLGEGEVRAEVNGRGSTHIAETGVPGVWWVTHYDEDEEVMAEFIEVAFCPEILLSAAEDVREGLDALQARLLEEHLGGRRDEGGT